MAGEDKIQELIQGLGVTIPNNGNPNTIWNTPGTVQQGVSGAPFVAYAGSNPGQMPPPPMHSAAGNWQLNSISAPANLGPMTVQPFQFQPKPPGSANTGPAWQAPVVQGPNLPTWFQPFQGFGGGPGAPTLPPGTPGTTTPPLGGPLPPEPLPGPGGGTPFGPGGEVGDHGQERPSIFDSNNGMTAFGSGSPFNQSFSIFDPRFAQVINGPEGQQRLAQVQDQTNGFMNNLSQEQKDKLYGLMDPNKGFDWKQAIDMVTEPWFQTNMYLAGLNEWDTSNILAGLAQAITGLPINQIMTYFGQQQAFQDDPQNWFEQQLVDHYMDNLRNDYIQDPEGTLKKLEAMYQNATNQDVRDNIAGQMARLQTTATQGDLMSQVFGPACVTVDSVLEDYPRADAVKVGDTMIVRDPLTNEESTGVVSVSDSKTVQCVRITTQHGIVLECSEDAPIADIDGNQVFALELEGKIVPVVKDDQFFHDIVTTVQSIGRREVQHITVENNFFLAGKVKGSYLFHHNVKQGSTYQAPTSGGAAYGGGWMGGQAGQGGASSWSTSNGIPNTGMTGVGGNWNGWGFP